MKFASSIKTSSLIASLGIMVSFGFASTASAQLPPPTGNTNLQKQIAEGDAKIARRLSDLQTLTTRVQSLSAVSNKDKDKLVSNINGTAAGLTALKKQLDKETTLSAAETDVQNIYSNFRVYLLVIPRVRVISLADFERIQEANWTTVATVLQPLVGAAQDKATLTPLLNDAVANLSQAHTTSVNDEAKVLALQPSDYNSDHSVLSGNFSDLKGAEAKVAKAKGDMKTIIAALKKDGVLNQSVSSDL